MLTINKIAKGSKSKVKPIIVGRAVKATLYYLNGTTSEIVLIIPMHPLLGDPVEEGNIMMREYVQSLTVCYIKISRFETVMGSMLSDNTFKPFHTPINHEIPLNKVFQEGDCGKWVNPKDRLSASTHWRERRAVMLTTPFNPEIKSELSPIRIEQLNHLTVQAFKNDKTTTPDMQPNMNDLVIESCATRDVLTELIQLRHSTAFYRIIDAAFSALIEEGRSEPVDIFNTYKTLMSLFRVAEREREVINSKISELDQIQADLDTLESEEFRRSKQRKSKKAKSKNSSNKKGGLSCV